MKLTSGQRAAIESETRRRFQEKPDDAIWVNDCSLCHYHCGYYQAGRLGTDYYLVYDSGCYCTGAFSIERCDWDDLCRLLELNPERIEPFLAGGSLFEKANA